MNAVDAGDVLDERARLLARPAGDETPSDARELLVVSIGEVKLAVDIGRVREVLPPGRLARVPGREHALAGLRNVRGEVVVVADAGTLLGLVHDVPRDDRWVVVLDGHGGPLGVLVDEADGLVTVPGDAVGPSPLEDGPLTGVVGGTTRAGTLIIDADALLVHPALFVRPDRAGEPTDLEEPT